MKKILLGTTAIIALSTISAEAFAADKIKLELGGFMKQHIGLTNSDEFATTRSDTARAMDLGQRSNSEVYFTGSTVLDNGMTVSATIQREADASATSGDRSFLTISSAAMGSLSMGNINHAGDAAQVGAPGVGPVAFEDLGGWASYSKSTTAASAANTFVANDATGMGDNAVKLSYVSPSFSGIALLASYSAGEGTAANNAQNLTRNAQNDGSTLGVTYSGEMSGAGVNASLIRFKDGGADLTRDQFGLEVSMAGFTVGGAYNDFNDQRTGSSVLDGKGWQLGVGYETGPISVSASYYNSKNNGTVATAGDNEDTVWVLAGAYDLGAGVSLNGEYFDQSSDPEGTTALLTSRDTSGVIAGISVDF